MLETANGSATWPDLLRPVHSHDVGACELPIGESSSTVAVGNEAKGALRAGPRIAAAPFRRLRKRRPCEGTRRGFLARLRSAYANAGTGGAWSRGCSSSTAHGVRRWAAEFVAGSRRVTATLASRRPRARPSPPLPPVTSAPQDLRDVSAVMPVPRLPARPRAAARRLAAVSARCASARGRRGRRSRTA